MKCISQSWNDIIEIVFPITISLIKPADYKEDT
jgi:hypothetical protein